MQQISEFPWLLYTPKFCCVVIQPCNHYWHRRKLELHQMVLSTVKHGANQEMLRLANIEFNPEIHAV
jgi:hypothetical protein